MPHVEIAGAGLAGLTAGLLFARAGWTVRVHERGEAVREIGAGILMARNGLDVLSTAGVLSELEHVGVTLDGRRMLNGRGMVLFDSTLAEGSRPMMVPRRRLIQAISEAAVRAGVTVKTSSRIVGADPRGALWTETGERFEADVVLGCDGHRSAVRDSARLGRTARPLDTTSVRTMLPSRRFAPDAVTRQYWAGRRRFSLTACGPDATYVYMSCPRSDPVTELRAGWVESWTSAFPCCREGLNGVSKRELHIAPYRVVRPRSWRTGRVAIVGDAAHAMPPTLGQGANLALMNAAALVRALDGDGARDVPAALAEWEAAMRPMTDRTQRWSYWYDRVSSRWPERLIFVRQRLIGSAAVASRIDRHVRAAERAR